MARIFITGSVDGLGAAAAQRLAADGHAVVLHARTDERAEVALRHTPLAEGVLVADVSTMSECRRLAELVNRNGRFDAVIHNVGVFHNARRDLTADGLSPTFAVNTVAPYILTCAMVRPARLVYLSSDMHASGSFDPSDLGWVRRRWDGNQAYSDSKLNDTMLAFAVARRWPGVLSNAVDPGWVATRMGGAGAPDDLDAGSATQAWLASSTEAAACVSGKLFHHCKPCQASADARSPAFQDALLERLAHITGITLPT